MRCYLLLILCILLSCFAFLGSTSEYIINSYHKSLVAKEIDDVYRAPARRALLTDTKEPETALVAALDGTIYLVEENSLNPLWSFRSGPSIYSSYQAPVDDKDNSSGIERDYFIECGDDWALYAHTKLGKLRLTKSIEEYISSTPQITEDGGIVLGSKKSSAFLINAKTGVLIHTNKITDSSSINGDHEVSISMKNLQKNDELPLYITRTDYALTSFAPNSNKVLWNVTIAEIGAAFLCPDINASALNDSFNMPLPCQSRALIYRSRTPNVHTQDPMLPNPIERFIHHLPSPPEELIKPENNKLNKRFKRLNLFFPILFATIFLGVIIYKCYLVFKKQNDAKTLPLKRKKNKKSAKNQDIWANLNENTTQFIDGRTIGKLFVSNNEIAKGSNGTIVFEGIYEGRKVAVKRLVRAHHDVAFKEIQNLIASDQHQNIVRWYGVEHDRDFVYLSLELCVCSLNDLVLMHSEDSKECSVDSIVMNDTMQDIMLWKPNGYPSPILLKILRDIVHGLAHLHELGIIHRDLKPQNILMIRNQSIHAKLSDMGISKRLVGDTSSLGHQATGYGSCGWQAPEQILHGRQTRAVDLFSLGCVIFFCITGGKHPFGNRIERDFNIVKNKMDLFLVQHVPEALHLLLSLLDPNPEIRPKAMEVLSHPLFWSADLRLSFLRDTSDRVELEDRESNSVLLKELESISSIALGGTGKWDEKMEPAFINNIGSYRRYKFNSIRDLLRVMRNKLNHYRELPTQIQGILGSVPEGFESYFTNRFPKLLIEVYRIIYKHCKDEECFRKYFKNYNL